MPNLGSDKKYYHEIIGRNSRLDIIQAGILRIKLKYLDENNEKRRKNAEIYFDKLKDCKHIILPKIEKKVIPVWHLFVIRVLNNKRELLKEYLKENNIETLIHYPIPIHKQKSFIEHNNEQNVICESISKEILSLPMFPELQEEEIITVCTKIKDFF